MAIQITSTGYVDYLCAAAGVIEENKDYITALDSKTGDGDHWVNLNMGFGKIVEQADALRAMDLSAMLKKVGITMMSGVGGSSGVLYGGAYIAAVKGRTSYQNDRGFGRAGLGAVTTGVQLATLTDTILQKKG